MAYIQALQLRDFRQFQDVEIQPHPRLNVFVGNNGEGKSNLLESIFQLIVQSDGDERARMIRTGVQSAVLCGYFPGFSIQKTLTPRFEEFRCDDRVLAFKQLRCRLESDGFTRFCYLRYNAADLYSLLSDLYEVQDFDERQRANRQSLKNARKMHAEAQELLGALSQQAQALEAERGELLEYYTIFEQKYAAERAIATFDLTEVAAKIDANEAETSAVIHYAMEARRAEQENAATQQAADTQIAAAEQAITQAAAQMRTAKQQKLELDELIAASPEFYVSVYSQSQTVLSSAEELQSIAPQRQTILYQIAQCNAALARDQGTEQSADQLKAEIARLKALRQETTQKMQQLQAEVDALREPAFRHSNSARKQYDDAVQRQARAQAASVRSSKQLQALQYDLEKAQAELSRALPYAVSYPLQYLHNFVQQRPDAYAGKYFGPLYYNVRFDEGLASLMDAAAGMQLFSVVVDTESTALRLIDALNAESQVDPELRGTRIQFLPLENYADVQSVALELPNGAMQLSQLIEAEERFRALVDGLFGRAAVCQTMTLAGEVSHAYRIECYTLDGDCATNGLLTGGFRNPLRTRCCLEVQQQFSRRQQASAALEAARAELTGVQGELRTLQQRLIAEEREEQYQAAELAKVRLQRFQLDEELRNAATVFEEHDQQIQQLTARLARRIADGAGDAGDAPSSYTQRPEELKATLQQLELDLFKLEQRRDFLAQKLQVDQQRRATLQAALDVQVARLRRALSNVELPAAVSISEALEVAQRVANELYEQITAAAAAQRDAQHALEAATTSQAQLQEKARELRGKLADLEFREAQLKFDAQELLRARQALNIKLLSAGPVVTAAPDQQEGGQQQAQPHFATRGEAVKVAGAAQLSLQKFYNLNKLAVEQYQLLRQKLDASRARLQRLESEQSGLEAEVAACDERFQRRFQDVFDQVQTNYKRFLHYLQGLGGEIRVDGEKIELVVDVPGKPSNGQAAAARVAYALALQSYQPVVLLDECDAALDASARERYAALLAELSAEKQIFCISFNKAVCQRANAVFLISNGRVSDVSCDVVEYLAFLQ